MLQEHPCPNPVQNQPGNCGKEGEKRERETDAECPQEPAKDAWRGGGKAGKQRKIKQESRWSRPDPAAWLRLTCESHPSSSASLRLPTGNNCQVPALLQSLPRLPFFWGFTEENKAAVTGMAGWEELFQKEEPIPNFCHPSRYQRPFISVPFSASLRFPFALFNPRFSRECQARPPLDRLRPSGNSSL